MRNLKAQIVHDLANKEGTRRKPTISTGTMNHIPQGSFFKGVGLSVGPTGQRCL